MVRQAMRSKVSSEISMGLVEIMHCILVQEILKKNVVLEM